MTSTSSPPGTLGLWLAATTCAAVGAVLLGPGLYVLIPGLPASRAAAPQAVAPSPAVSTTDSPSPAATTTGPAPLGEPSTSASPTPVQDEQSLPHDDEQPTAPSARPLPANQVAGHTDADAAPADEQHWRPVLIGFTTDFTQLGKGPADWAGRLSRWTTPQLAASYRRVDPHRVPTGRLVEIVSADVGAYTLTFTARYDTSLIVQGQAALGPQRWEVVSAESVAAPTAR